MTAIVLRKDFQRIRARVKSRIRAGKIRAQIQETRRVDQVVDALCDKIDFYNGYESESEVAEILQAILREWDDGKGLGENEMVWYFRQVVITGVLRVMAEKGEVETRRDSYGRVSYRGKE